MANLRRADVRELLDEYAHADKRIRIAFRATNGHISANSNSALDLATGDYVALLDADDVITEDALFWVAHEIALHPDVDMLFSDEDKIDEAGRRFDPYFKPAWNAALMLGQNMFCHLGVYRRALVEQVQGANTAQEVSELLSEAGLPTFHDLICQEAWSYAMSLTHQAYPLELLLLGRAGEVLGRYPPLENTP